MASLAKRIRKQAKKRLANVSKSAKEVGRNVARVAAPIVKYGAPVLQAAANVFLGPAAGAAVTVGTTALNRYVGATAARDKGLTGRAARAKGRSAAAFSLKTGVAITGLTVGLNALSGGSLLQSGLSGFTQLTGIGGGGAAPSGALAHADALDQQALTLQGTNPGLAQSLHAQAASLRQADGGGAGLSEIATLAGKFFGGGQGAVPTDFQTQPLNPNASPGLPTFDGGFNSFSAPAVDPVSAKNGGAPAEEAEGGGAALALLALVVLASKKAKR